MTPLSGPTQWKQVLRVWYRNYVIFRRTWMVSLFWVMLEPIFILTAVGFGLGSYVKTIGGMPFAEFFFPGLLCSSTMMVAFFEGTYGNFSKLTYSKVYLTQLLSPLTVHELVLGDLLWGATKGTLSGLAILIVGGAFGLGHSWLCWASLPILFLNAWLFSALGMIVTSRVKNYDQIIYPTSGFIVPMSLFAGTYFPIQELNPFFHWGAYLLPLTYSTEVVRAMATDNLHWTNLLHVLVLFLSALLLTRVASSRMQRRLQQ